MVCTMYWANWGLLMWCLQPLIFLKDFMKIVLSPLFYRPNTNYDSLICALSQLDPPYGCSWSIRSCYLHILVSGWLWTAGSRCIVSLFFVCHFDQVTQPIYYINYIYHILCMTLLLEYFIVLLLYVLDSYVLMVPDEVGFETRWALLAICCGGIQLWSLLMDHSKDHLPDTYLWNIVIYILWICSECTP